MIRPREAILLDMLEGIAAAVDGLRDEGGAKRLAERIYNARSWAAHVRTVEGIPDTMAAGWNRPAPATGQDVCDVLRGALAHVEAGDCFEGTITWEMPMDEPELEGFEFGLVARYRVGNLDGQGGLRVYQRAGS